MAYKDLIGNEKIKKLLEQTVKNDKVLHSYLFSGKDGIGKYLIAKEFAKSILCQNDSEIPCNQCKSCLEFESCNHPDYYLIEPDGNSIKIDQIRYSNAKILEKPVNSNKKVYIIRDSHKMTKEAQNSLLKTLEEPPEYAVIILITSQEERLLTTIKSRCTKISFEPLKDDEIVEYFKKQGEILPETILKLAEGSISKALKLIPKQEVYDKMRMFISNIETIEKLEILKQEFIYQEKDDIQNILDDMNSLLFQKVQENENKIAYIRAIELIEETKERLRSNSNFDMCIDNLLLNIWEEINEKYCRS